MVRSTKKKDSLKAGRAAGRQHFEAFFIDLRQ
jgi:hypothetical protein